MQKTIQTRAKPFNSTVTIPGSKSITNRALLLASVAEGKSTLSGVLASNDTLAFRDALIALGVPIKWDEKALCCVVQGVNGRFPTQNATVWCQDAGTAARFLLAACASSKGEFDVDASEQLRARPLAPLINALRAQGATFTPENATALPLHLRGIDGLKGGEIAIEGGKSGQFLSALLMVAPLATSPVSISVDKVVSKPYIDMTCRMMADFGASVNQPNENMFTIATPQQYRGIDYAIEPDCSTASYFFAAAALTQSRITIPNINRDDCLQGDIRFLEVLEKMGCDVTHTASTITVQGPTQLQGITIDMGDFSDTFMTLAAIAPFANSPVTISNLAHTRLQESDRLQAVNDNLNRLHIKTDMEQDAITIYPGMPVATTLPSYEDHRIAMAFSLIGLKVPDIVINGAECVAKTCPHYFDLIARL